jgi:hypothetical protein
VVTIRTGKPCGRPPYDFFRDPERFAVALVDALTVLGVSEGDALKTAAAQIVGSPVELRTIGPRRKRGRGSVPGGTVISYDEGAVTIAGRGDTVRRKYKRSCPPEVAAWRRAMGRAFLLALTGKDPDRCAAKVMELAASVGEAGYAEAALLPMLVTKRFPPPDFTPDV